MLVAFAGSDEQTPAWKPATRHERKWEHIIEPASRTKLAMDELNRSGIVAFRKRGMPETVREIVRQVAERRRVTIMLLASASRMRIAVEARNEAMYLIKQRNPKTSACQIARWFDRDHSVVLYGISSHQERYNLPKLVGYDVVKRRARMMGSSS